MQVHLCDCSSKACNYSSKYKKWENNNYFVDSLSLSLSLFVSAICMCVWGCVCMCKQAEEKCKVNKTELEEKRIYGSAELGSSLCDEVEVFL